MNTLDHIRELAEKLAAHDPLAHGPAFTGSRPGTRNRARAAVRQNIGRELIAILDAKDAP